MTLYKWSQVAATDATADSTINWAEGQAPSSVNDSARGMMAATAKYRDDISGAIATGGTSTAYTLTSFQVFDSLAHLNGQMVAFTPHTTNGATVTLNCDGLGAKPLRSAPSTELLAGTLIQGTPYLALYNLSDAVFYLHGFFGNAYNIPLGASLEFWGTTAPNSSFVFPFGQAISRTTYSALFSLIGTTYGAGDASTTFNIPDVRGRIVASKDDMGGSAASRLTSGGSGVNGAALNGSGGAEIHTLLTANLPAYTPTGTITNGALVYDTTNATTGTLNALVLGQHNGGPVLALTQSGSTFTGTAQGGISTPVVTMPPTIVANRIMRII